jgi:endonuclease YncB( thermonuclease family)
MSSYRYGRPWRRARQPRHRYRKFLDYALTFAILGLLVVVSSRLDRVETRQATGVVTVNDGDTLTLNGEKIRLRGIDAPEYNQTCLRGGEEYPCGRRSRDALGKLIAGRAVTCAGWERDRYGRLLGNCSAGKEDLNEAQVASGWAVAYGDYFEREDEARARRLGLWAGEFERPRDWRQSHGDMVDGEHGRIGTILNWLRAIFFS